MDRPHVIVLFGATGDLARRKLLPGLLRLFEAGLVRDARIIGTSLEDVDTEHFVKLARDACEEFGKGTLTEERWARFASLLGYVPQGRGPHALAAMVVTVAFQHGITLPHRVHAVRIVVDERLATEAGVLPAASWLLPRHPPQPGDGWLGDRCSWRCLPYPRRDSADRP